MQFDVMRFPSYAFDPATGKATFDYVLDGPTPLTFTETITFPVPDMSKNPEKSGGSVGARGAGTGSAAGESVTSGEAAGAADAATAGSDGAGMVSAVPAAFYRVLDLLHVVAGVSYFKVGAPGRVVAPKAFPKAAADYFTAIYTKGMAEYAYRNRLPHVLELQVEMPGVGDSAAPFDNSGGRPLSAVGGGKDSIVTLEILRAAGLDPVPFSVNPNGVIKNVNAASGLDALAARRQLDPRLFELNKAGALNGHIPVTAINSLIAIATAVWHGLGPVVMSNERSASDPNLIWNGHEVNHQWSKGVEAEGLLRDAVTAHAGVTEPYFSLLRSLSELHIAQLFARYTAYDDVVTSCNKAFKLHDPTVRWCGDCPKCRFVFLAMAPAMDRTRLTKIFGHDLFADEAQVPGYLELLGIDAHKPFECVGEVEESVVALSMLDDDAPVLVALRNAVPAEAWAAASRDMVMTPGGPTYVPAAYAKILNDAL